MDCLPAWIDAELWAEYVQQRKKDKKAMSPRSERERLARLYELKAAGHDPNKCLSEALNGHWLDFYAVQDKTIERAPSSGADRTRQELEEARSRETSRPPDVLKSLVQRLKLRA